MRPLVLDAGLTLAVTLRKGEEVLLTADGQKGAKVRVGDLVRISRSEVSAPLVTTPGRDYFALLREKLSWGAGRSLS
jgi:NAD+ kinase